MCLSIHFLIFVHVFCKGYVNYIMITWELKWIWEFSPKFCNHSTCYKPRISVGVNISFHPSEQCFCKKKSAMGWLLYYHKLWDTECSNKVITVLISRARSLRGRWEVNPGHYYVFSRHYGLLFGTLAFLWKQTGFINPISLSLLWGFYNLEYLKKQM